jgi:general secretion pathway protein L
MATNAFLSRDFSLASLTTALASFFAWERAQCRALLPATAMAWLTGRGAREVVVAAGASELLLPGGGEGQSVRIAGAEIAETSLDAALARRKLTRQFFAIVLELPVSAFLIRRLDLPAAALGHLPQMIQSEIERKTPFRRDDILVGWRVDTHEAKGKAKVRIAVLRRDLMAPALERAGLVLGDLAAIRAEAGSADASDQSIWTPVIAVRADSEANSPFARIALAMTVLAILFVAVALGSIFWRQNAEAQALDARIEDMSARAAHVRQIADRATKESRQLAALRETRISNPRLTDLWEEVSRLTPDSAYLTDFHLSESKAGERGVDLAGFAQSAVGLPLLFDQSRFFSEAALTAPITSDPKDKRETFSLRLKVRAAPEAARGTRPAAEPGP